MNEVCAAATICFEYSGYCAAVFAALENGVVSSDCTLVLRLLALGEPAMSVANEAAYPAVSNAPRIDCMIAPPRSRWRSAVADATRARRTATAPVRECGAGVPASPTPVPMK